MVVTVRMIFRPNTFSGKQNYCRGSKSRGSLRIDSPPNLMRNVVHWSASSLHEYVVLHVVSYIHLIQVKSVFEVLISLAVTYIYRTTKVILFDIFEMVCGRSNSTIFRWHQVSFCVQLCIRWQTKFQVTFHLGIAELHIETWYNYGPEVKVGLNM